MFCDFDFFGAPVGGSPSFVSRALGGEDEAGVGFAVGWFGHHVGEVFELGDIVCAAFAGAVEEEDEGVLFVGLDFGGREEAVFEFVRFVWSAGVFDGEGFVGGFHLGACSWGDGEEEG